MLRSSFHFLVPSVYINKIFNGRNSWAVSSRSYDAWVGNIPKTRCILNWDQRAITNSPTVSYLQQNSRCLDATPYITRSMSQRQTRKKFSLGNI